MPYQRILYIAERVHWMG